MWCRFKQDVLDAVAAVEAAGKTAWRYDGAVPAGERERAYQAFRAGERDAIVATVASGLQRGKDLTRAGTLVYYSNDFSRRARGQSEDRSESLDRTFSTGIVDLVATDTRDGDVVDALRRKLEVARTVMGDDLIVGRF